MLHTTVGVAEHTSHDADAGAHGIVKRRDDSGRVIDHHIIVEKKKALVHGCRCPDIDHAGIVELVSDPQHPRSKIPLELTVQVLDLGISASVVNDNQFKGRLQPAEKARARPEEVRAVAAWDDHRNAYRRWIA